MSDISLARPTWAKVQLNNLKFNFKSAKDFIGSDLLYMAVVKADAYGHGAVPCAKTLVKSGADWLGVALPEEGLELRNGGIRLPILCLGGFWPRQEDLVQAANLTPVIFRLNRPKPLIERHARGESPLRST